MDSSQNKGLHEILIGLEPEAIEELLSTPCREVIQTHIDGCETCGERRRQALDKTLEKMDPERRGRISALGKQLAGLLQRLASESGN